MSHFVVLKKFKRGELHIFDPARGFFRMKLAEASPHFTGIALELTPTADFAQLAPAPPINWRQLVGRVHGLKRSLGQMLLLAASLQLFLLIIPLFTQWIVDQAIVAGDFELLWVLVIGFSFISIIKVGLEAARSWLGIVASAQFGMQWSAKVMAHLLRLPLQWFEVRYSGDVISRFQSLQAIQQTVTGKLVEIFLDSIFAAVVLLVMLLYSVKLTLIVLVAVIGYAAIRILPHGAYHRLSDEVLVQEAKAQTHFIESLRAIQVVKISRLEEQRAANWSNMIVGASNQRTKSQTMLLAFTTGYGLVFATESVVILGWGASMTIQGVLSIGMLMAFISYKDEFSSRMQRFVDNLMAIRLLKLHTDRLADIVMAIKEDLGSSIEGSYRQDAFAAKIPLISLRDVGFRYGADENWIFRNLNLDLRPGEHVAIVGATGCGKTTLAKIVLGLLEPSEGSILIDGVSLKQSGLGNWRGHVAAVMQDDQLFSGSLIENIGGFDAEIDMDRICEVSMQASIHEEITQMPMGYRTLNGDMGSSLSGGQKQRILLARALYRNPKVLVLDEATSHLDVEKEKSVNSAIDRLLITRITIAHRPETIAMAERVIDLKALRLLNLK